MTVEIDLGTVRWTMAMPIIVVALAALMLLGRATTPPDGGVLTPSQWRLRQAERAYAVELTGLRSAASDLVDLVNAGPDPVRAGLLADRIDQLTLSGQPSLDVQRQALRDASEAVRSWAMGGASRDEAVAALDNAIALSGGEPGKGP
jgi:hypothetical protein